MGGELKDLPGELKDLPKPWGCAWDCEGLLKILPWKFRDGPVLLRDAPVLPGLNVLPFAVRGADPDPKVRPAVPVRPRDLAVSTLRFMIELAPFRAPGEWNAAVCVIGVLNPLVFIVGSTLMV